MRISTNVTRQPFDPTTSGWLENSLDIKSLVGWPPWFELILSKFFRIYLSMFRLTNQLRMVNVYLSNCNSNLIYNNARARDEKIVNRSKTKYDLL